MNARHIVAALAVSTLAIATAHAQTIVYPAKGQSAEQQQKDEGECTAWAKNETGVDPAALAAETTTTQEARGGRVRGAARGAALGAIGGAIAGDAGTGAAAGAAVGGVGGGMRQRRERRQQEQTAEAQQEQKQASLGQYTKAYEACLEGRGYTVK